MTPAEVKQTLGYGAQSEIAAYLGVSVAHVFYVIGVIDKRKQLVRREDVNVQREIARRLGLSVRQVFGDEAPPPDIWPKKKRTRRAVAR
jgi:F0F1-type ATP synthase alpha subunit